MIFRRGVRKGGVLPSNGNPIRYFNGYGKTPSHLHTPL